MSTTYETEPTTIAAAWSTSPLGDPTSEPTEGWDGGIERVMPATKPTSIARHALVIVALACGVGLGAALGLAVFDSTERTQPMVTVPRVEAPSVGPTSPAHALPAHDPASKPEHLPLPKPTVAAPESAPVIEDVPAAAEQSRTEVSSPTAVGPSYPNFAPPSSGTPGDAPATVDIDLPQIPQPTPANPQKPGPTVQLGPASDLPAMEPQLPPKVTKLPPKSRFTVNMQNQQPSKPKRGMPSTKPPRTKLIAKAGTANDE
jgi:hypothetical protein